MPETFHQKAPLFSVALKALWEGRNWGSEPLGPQAQLLCHTPWPLADLLSYLISFLDLVAPGA